MPLGTSETSRMLNLVRKPLCGIQKPIHNHLPDRVFPKNRNEDWHSGTAEHNQGPTADTFNVVTAID